MNHEFLSFMIAEEEYGVPILAVREVRGWSPIRAVPNVPEYVLGVLELRGEYVPIVDLRMRFALTPSELSATTVVVVLNDENHHPLGIIVDAVAEVHALTHEQIKPTPVTLAVQKNYIRGIVATDQGHLILINLPALFDVNELHSMALNDALT